MKVLPILFTRHSSLGGVGLNGMAKWRNYARDESGTGKVHAYVHKFCVRLTSPELGKEFLGNEIEQIKLDTR